MANSLDPREVLEYLNQLGYQNITSGQLKEFMKDLKKLIKYENRQREAEIENIRPFEGNHFAGSVYAPTESSKAKQVPKKESVISVKIKRPPIATVHECENINHPHLASKQPFHSSTPFNDQQGTSSHLSEAAESSETSVHHTSPKRSKSCDPTCGRAKSKVSFKGHILKPAASYIIPRLPTKTLKSDPVALYHKYQQGWKKHKLPGEDNHTDLRWAIRERMLGQQPRTMSAAPSMETIARKRRTSRI